MTEQSHAKSTAFVHARIDGPNNEFLYIDGNAKVTARNGSYDEPRPNAFSLVEIEDCPYRTTICEKSCYVHGLKEHAPDVHDIFVHNSSTIRRIIDHGDSLRWSRRMGFWIGQNCEDFRWHVSGDLFSFEYAKWVATVCYWSPSTRHWIYTRSVAYLEPLVRASNLIVNLSADAENYTVMRAAARDYGLRLCYLTHDGSIPNDLPRDAVIFPDYEVRGRASSSYGHEWFDHLPPHRKQMVCPADFFGKSKNRRCGPCSKCMVNP